MKIATIDIDQIPKELKELDNWIVWRYEAKELEGQINMVPFTHLGEEIRSSLVEVGSSGYAGGSFEEAVHTLTMRTNQFDGIGIVPTYENKLALVCWKKCVISETSELRRDVLDELVVLDSYAEMSVDGKETHCIVFGSTTNWNYLWGSRRITDELNPNFIPISGNRIEGTPQKVTYADEEIWDLYEKWYHEEMAEVEEFRYSYEEIEDTEKRMRVRDWVINDLEVEIEVRWDGLVDELLLEGSVTGNLHRSEIQNSEMEELEKRLEKLKAFQERDRLILEGE